MAEEQKIEQKFKEQAELRGWKALKLSCPGFNGMPDRLILKDNGQVFFAEMKAPGELLRPIQIARTAMLRRMGFRVYVIDEMIKVFKVLEAEERISGV